MAESLKTAFTLLAGLCIAAGILVFSAGMWRYHTTRREDYRYDVEFDRARTEIVSATLYTGLVLLGSMLVFLALARWCR